MSRLDELIVDFENTLAMAMEFGDVRARRTLVVRAARVLCEAKKVVDVDRRRLVSMAQQLSAYMPKRATEPEVVETSEEAEISNNFAQSEAGQMFESFVMDEPSRPSYLLSLLNCDVTTGLAHCRVARIRQGMNRDFAAHFGRARQAFDRVMERMQEVDGNLDDVVTNRIDTFRSELQALYGRGHAIAH